MTQSADPHTSASSTGDVTADRYYTFGGATVAMRHGSQVNMGASPPVTGIWYLFGDIQGSIRAMVSDARDTNGDPDPANAIINRNAYTPYGQTPDGTQLDSDRGWLGQITDEAATGLVYLNARYYDPVAARFVSPDPIIKPTDPRTLDPYRYADNNPVLFADSNGLAPSCSGLVPGTDAYKNCAGYVSTVYNYSTGYKSISTVSGGESNARNKKSAPPKTAGPGYGITATYIDGVEQIPAHLDMICTGKGKFCPSAVITYYQGLVSDPGDPAVDGDESWRDYIDTSDSAWGSNFAPVGSLFCGEACGVGFPTYFPGKNGAENLFWVCLSPGECSYGNLFQNMAVGQIIGIFGGSNPYGDNSGSAYGSGAPDVGTSRGEGRVVSPQFGVPSVGSDGNFLQVPPGFGLPNFGDDFYRPEGDLFCRNHAFTVFPSEGGSLEIDSFFCVAG